MKMVNFGTVMSMISAMEVSFQMVHMLMSQQQHFHTQLAALVQLDMQTLTFNAPQMIVLASAPVKQ